MAEVLIVVAIIVVLMGVGFIALMSHMRNMQKLEMDGQAKEIFVAAQNHLSLAKSQDYLGVAEYVGETTTMTGDFGIAEDAEKHIYYIVVNNASAVNGKGDPLLAQMLPFASVNEAARTGGSYIIRYQKDPAQILDVFYVSTTGRYGLASGFKADDDHNDYEETLKGFIAGTSDVDLKEYGETKAVVGYYGGGTAGVPVGEKLKTPGVEIENGDRLLVKVTDYNSTSNEGTNELLLMIKSGDSIVNIPLVGTNVMNNANNARVTSTSGTDYTTYTVVLDDVTTYSGSGEADMHFFKLGGIAAGSNIQVVARAYSNKYVADIAESPAQETNSLFASKNGSTVEIASIRHLLNLDSMISGLSESVTSAVQISDLDWIAFMKNTRDKETEDENYKTQIFTVVETEASPIRYSAAGSYMPVNAPSGLVYQGMPGTNHITGITVTGGTGDAGLFASLSGGSVTDLELVDFKISASGNVGALVGTATSTPTKRTTITGVLVHNSKTGGTQISDKYSSSGADIDYKIESSGSGKAAGGLIGEASGNVTVTNCAAAVYVAADSDAGGLIGTANTGNLTVESSYSGGHTENAKYAALSPAGVTTVVNVQSTAGNAGGLVGHAGGVLTVTYSYSTASASSGGSGVGVGGLVGKTDGAAQISNCYAVGLVTAPAGSSAQISPFAVGAFSGTNNYYLASVSPMANVTPDSAKVTAVSSGDTSSELILPEASRKKAIPYDSTLTLNYKGQFFFPTVDQLHPTGWMGGKSGITDVHYGDWQIPQNTPLNYLLINGNTLDLIVELKDSTKELTFAVTGASSGNTRIFNLKLEKGDSAWTVTSATETAVVGDTVQPNSKDVSSYFTGASARFGAFEFSDTTYPAQATSLTYASGFKGKRTYSNGETFYDVKLTLDDITKSNGHFAQLLADTFAFGQTEGASPTSISAQLIPGENITVRATSGNAAWSELKEIKDIDDSSMESHREQHEKDVDDYQIPDDYHCGTSIDNSLFATSSNSNIAVMSSASIVNVRHLQNLDVSVSMVNNTAANVTEATLENDIAWNPNWNSSGTGTTVYAYTTATGYTACAAGKLNGIYCPRLETFNGKNHVISDLQVGASKGNSGSGNTGLFRLVTSSLTIKNLHLQDPGISTTTSYAGAIVAENRGTLILDTVLAESATSDIGGTTAGGLVGVSSGTSLTIKNSAASLYVTAADGAAGGLLGQQSDGRVEIVESYVGGHTEGGMYSGSGTGRWNIVSNSDAAGGLIGETADGTSTGIEKSFNAASVYSGVSNKAGGIVGNALGSFAAVSGGSGSILDLVYTVAPVCSVKTMDYDADTLTILNSVASGSNGAVFGNLANTPTGQRLFYLADVYADAKFNQEVTASNISYIGVGNLTGVKLASYYAERDAEGNFIGDSAAIIGLASSGESLEFETNAFDEKLIEEEKEYPFSIWTTFAFSTGTSQRHFYGDWQPVENEASKLFKFYFLKEEPEDALEDDVPIVSFGSQTGFYQMAVLMIPFGGADLPIPTIPYIPGFDYGTKDNHDVRWTVYYGDQRDALMSGSSAPKSTTTYKEEGGTVELQETDLQAVMTETYGNTMTFVAHYYDPGDQYIFRLMDYDPTAETAEYRHYGAIQVIQPENPGEAVSLRSVYEADKLFVPRRNQSGYHFLGWYTQPTGGTQVFGLNDSGNIVLVNDISVSGNLTLYARYQEKEEVSVTVKFVLKEDEIEYPLDAEYQVKFDKNQGLNQKITLPGEVKGIRVTKAMTAGGTATAVQLGSGTEAEFIPNPEDSDLDKYVRLTTGVLSEYPAEYTVYIEGYVDTVYYAVVHVLENTEISGTDLKYSLGNTATYLTEYRQTLENVYPTISESDLADLTGFSHKLTQDFNYTSENTYGIDSQYNGKDVKYIFVLTYERNQYLLSFEDTGDSYFAPVWVYYDQLISDVLEDGDHTPTYAGYDFQGWVDKSGTEDVAIASDRRMQDSNFTVYGKWLGEPVKYTLLVWLQNADDDGYTLGYYDNTLQAPAGDTVTVAASDSGLRLQPATGTASYYTLASYYSDIAYFHLSTTKASDTRAEIKGNGSTQINVYYDRNIYTLWFFLGKRNDGSLNETKYDSGATPAAADDVGGNIGTAQNPKYVDLYRYTDVSQTFWGYPAAGTENSNIWGLVGGTYVELTRNVDEQRKYTPRYTYTAAANNDVSGAQYGLVTKSGTTNGDYVDLAYTTGYRRAVGDQYTMTTGNTEPQYGVYNGAIIPIYRNSNNGNWYRTKNANGSYSDRYNNTRYTKSTNSSTADYTDTVYIPGNNGGFTEGTSGTLYGRSGSNNNYTYFPLEAVTSWYRATYTATTATTGDYYVLINGEYVLKTIRHSSQGYYYYDDPSATNNRARVTTVYTRTLGAAYTGIRYKRASNTIALSEAPTCYTRSGSTAPFTYTAAGTLTDGTQYYYVDGNHGYVALDIEDNSIVSYTVKDTGAAFTGDVIVKYTGDLYKLTGDYYVSSSRTDYNYATTSHSSGWSRVVANGANPFKGVYTKTDTHTVGSYTYTSYYYNITARYGATIYNLWPDLGWMKDDTRNLGAMGSNYFVSWITKPGSGYRDRYEKLNSSDPNYLANPNIKGIYSMMSEELILVDGAAARDYEGNGNTPAHVMQGRYDTSVYHYKYIIHFGTGDGTTYPSDANHYQELLVDSAGYYPQQAELAFPGYDLDYRTPTTGQPSSYTGTWPINYYYQPHQWTLKLLDKDNQVVKSYTVYYGQSLPAVTTASSGNYFNPASITPASYSFQGWYDNALGEGEPFDFSGKMPDGDVLVYAKLVHDPVKVTFNAAAGYLDDGTAVSGGVLPSGTATELTVDYESTLGKDATYNGAAITGVFDDDGKVLAAYTPEKEGYTFKCWCYLSEDKVVRFSDAYKITSAITLYPLWEANTVAQDRPVTIKYQLVDYNNNVIGTVGEGSVTAEYRDADGNICFTAEGNVKIKDGDKVTIKAPDVEGYTHVEPSGTIYRVSEANHEIILRYRDASWKYDVEYYVQYENLENPASWVSAADYDAGADPKAILVTRVADVSAPSQYVLFGYTQPEVEGVNLTNYRFDHFVYDGVISYDNYITLHPDAGVESGKVVVRVYLVPDQDSIVVDDIVLYYDGTSKTDYEPDEQPLSIPVGASTAVHYVYYKPSADNSSYVRIEDPTEVTHAGTYGVRAYITVTVDDTKYLVWQSEISSIPPLHLYIQRRVVVLISGSSEKTSAELGTGYLTNRNVSDTTTSIAGMDTTGVAFGFVKIEGKEAEGAEYVFSANAFRRMPGTSPNVFTYEVKSNTLESDYNFFLFYGTLTVTE